MLEEATAAAGSGLPVHEREDRLLCRRRVLAPTWHNPLQGAITKTMAETLSTRVARLERVMIVLAEAQIRTEERFAETDKRFAETDRRLAEQAQQIRAEMAERDRITDERIG